MALTPLLPQDPDLAVMISNGLKNLKVKNYNAVTAQAMVTDAINNTNQHYALVSYTNVTGFDQSNIPSVGMFAIIFRNTNFNQKPIILVYNYNDNKWYFSTITMS